jgi:hypothetical protein
MKTSELLTTNHKALTINFDAEKYGTFAEISAGQEVARHFFHAGGAAGTVAKSISAYDMKFSDMARSQSLACRTETRTNDIQSEQLPVLVRLRDGSEISVKCHVQSENLGPFHAKTCLAYVLVRMIVEPRIRIIRFIHR